MIENPLNILWKDKCTVICREKLIDEKTGRTGFREKVLYSDLPCKISFTGKNRSRTASPAGAGETAALNFGAVLFLDSGTVIPPGCKIIVTHMDTVTAYKQSGMPNLYSRHQEIGLVLFEKWA